MTAPTNYRQDRIERLLKELRYEVELGMIQREIDETLTFEFIVSSSARIPGGVVVCKFETRPMLSYMAPLWDAHGRLRVVK